MTIPTALKRRLTIPAMVLLSSCTSPPRVDEVISWSCNVAAIAVPGPVKPNDACQGVALGIAVSTDAIEKSKKSPTTEEKP